MRPVSVRKEGVWGGEFLETGLAAGSQCRASRVAVPRGMAVLCAGKSNTIFPCLVAQKLGTPDSWDPGLRQCWP